MTHRRASQITPQQKRRIIMLAAVPFVGGLLLAGVLLFATSRLFDEASFYNNEGISAAEDGRYEEAVRQFSLAIETDPQAEYYYNRGLAYALQESYENAVADFSDAIRLDSSYEDAYYNRGMAHYQIGNHRAAVADFNTLLELAPDFEDALYQRALAYEALGNTEAALADYEVYLEAFEPTYAEEAQTRLDALRAES